MSTKHTDGATIDDPNSDISEAVTQALISEAVQVLNADPVKFNARGGVA